MLVYLVQFIYLILTFAPKHLTFTFAPVCLVRFQFCFVFKHFKTQSRLCERMGSVPYKYFKWDIKYKVTLRWHARQATSHEWPNWIILISKPHWITYSQLFSLSSTLPPRGVWGMEEELLYYHLELHLPPLRPIHHSPFSADRCKQVAAVVIGGDGWWWSLLPRTFDWCHTTTTTPAIFAL